MNQHKHARQRTRRCHTREVEKEKKKRKKSDWNASGYLGGKRKRNDNSAKVVRGADQSRGRFAVKFHDAFDTLQSKERNRLVFTRLDWISRSLIIPFFIHLRSSCRAHSSSVLPQRCSLSLYWWISSFLPSERKNRSRATSVTWSASLSSCVINGENINRLCTRWWVSLLRFLLKNEFTKDQMKISRSCESVLQWIGQPADVRGREFSSKHSILIHAAVKLTCSYRSSWTARSARQCCSDDGIRTNRSSGGYTGRSDEHSVDVQSISIARTERLSNVGPHIHLQCRRSRGCIGVVARIENIDTNTTSRGQTPHCHTRSLT